MKAQDLAVLFRANFLPPTGALERTPSQEGKGGGDRRRGAGASFMGSSYWSPVSSKHGLCRATSWEIWIPVLGKTEGEGTP